MRKNESLLRGFFGLIHNVVHVPSVVVLIGHHNLESSAWRDGAGSKHPPHTPSGNLIHWPPAADWRTSLPDDPDNCFRFQNLPVHPIVSPFPPTHPVQRTPFTTRYEVSRSWTGCGELSQHPYRRNRGHLS